jgi:hypothetical protein
MINSSSIFHITIADYLHAQISNDRCMTDDIRALLVQLASVGVNVSHVVLDGGHSAIDFLSTTITDERKISSGQLLNGDETARRLAFAKEIIETNLIN